MSGYGVYVWGQEGSVYRGQVRQCARSRAAVSAAVADGTACCLMFCAARVCPLLHTWLSVCLCPGFLHTSAVCRMCCGLGGAPFAQQAAVWSRLAAAQWSDSKMDGCGVKITKQPNGTFLAEEGQFVNDDWVSLGGPTGQGG